MKAYEIIETKHIAELNTDAVVLRHIRSGARIFTMKNDDSNKVFSIAFRTPAEDSTGVAHITEHSVLCGSEKFPLKDPFVELAKGSLNTFLNAMTYPDKTVYPIASTNDKDFDNLMDVYMDAVLHPNCIRDERILQQEGWHYEMKDLQSPLSYNGVVYNEMKGAFSNPDAVLERYTLHALYPDNTYANESGGDPLVIPELTFEKFREFHARFYHPSNSYIILYGDMDMEKKLDWLDRRYLSFYEAINPDSGISMQKPHDHLREEEQSYSVGENESLQKSTYLSLSYSIGDNLDAKQNLAFSVLDDALLSSPGAPLKQALLENGIGEDVYGGYEDGILQPYFSITAKNADRQDKKKFLKVIRETLEKLASEGLDHKVLLASIRHNEFQNREADYGRTPKGLIYALTAMDSWLYGGKPWLHLESAQLFEELREDVHKGYFEKLIREKLIDNTFASLVTVRPEKGLTEKQEASLRRKMSKYKAGFSLDEKKKIASDTAALKKYQDTPTAEEDLLKLPLLSREDISRKADEYHFSMQKAEGCSLLYSETPTRGIAYLRLNFNTSVLTEEELPYAGLLKNMLAYMDTEKRSYQDLSSDIFLHTGGLSFDISAYPDLKKTNYYTGVFGVDVKLFYDEIGYGLSIINEILHETCFEDKKRVREILNEARSRERMHAESASHTYAVNRASSYFSGTAAYTDLTTGISYDRFLDRVQTEFENDAEAFTARLADIAYRLFRLDNMFFSLTAEEEGRDSLLKTLPEWTDAFMQKEREVKFLREILETEQHTKDADSAKPQILLSGNRNEGFRTPSQVNYVARAGRFDTGKLPYTGSLKVLKMILNYEYLWLNLRVKGGAYGCMSGFGRSGEGFLVSYRDPHLRETLKVYEELPGYLRNFNASERDMTKYIIGAISELDTPKTNYTKSLLTVSAFLSGVDNAMLQRERDELLSTKAADIRALAQYIDAILATGASCTIGASAAVKDAADVFMTTEDLFRS